MKKTLLTMISLAFWIAVSAQIDTISTNIYQNGGNLGIGIEIPAHSLQIKDNIDTGIERNLLLINNLSSDSSSYTGLILKTGESNYQSVIQDYGINYTASPYYDFGGFFNLSNNSKGLIFHANSSNGIIKFYTGHDEVAGAGIERLRIDSVGNIGIGIKDPKVKLDINGGLKLGNTNETYEGVIRWTGSNFEGYDGNSWLSLTNIQSNLWQSNNQSIYNLQNNIGIGTDNPANKLHIVDSNTQILLGFQPAYDGPYVNIHGSPENEPGPMIAIGVATKVYYKYEDTLAMKNWAYLYGNNLNSGIAILPDMQYASKGIYIKRDGKVGINTKHPKVELDVNGGIKIGYSETNLPGTIRFTETDFEGYNGTTWLSFTALSNNPWQQITNEIYYNQGNVGIGTDSPKNALTIEGDETGWPGRIFFSIKNKSAGSNSLAYMAAEAGTSGNHSVFGHISETYTANDSPEELQDYGWVSSNGNGLIFCASKNNLKPGIIKFLSGQSSGTTFDERMRIDSTGYVGIGTKQPYAKLEIADGDIYISDIEKGIIMKSPDGNCWRGTLDNSGSLNFIKIECPNETTGLGESEKLILEQSVLIYPNPASDKINIEIKGNFGKVQYSVYNTSGKIVQNGKIKDFSKTVDISNLERGVYIFELKDLENNKIGVQKIIKD